MSHDTKTAPLAQKTRVLIVDDHPILRHGIAQLVSRESDFEACSEAGSVNEALAVLANQPTDVAIVDLSLEDHSSLELVRRARVSYPTLQCLVLSMHDERLHAERALRAGARGYLMKQEATRKIVAALRQVRAGRIYLSDEVSREILARLAGSAERVDSPGSAVGGLSDREMEVLRLIGRGLKTGEIARTLHRSVHTVEAHRANIKRKLGLRTSGDLARAAFNLSAPEAC
jgi:DNA-binding NarL/FixJ family response regulator